MFILSRENIKAGKARAAVVVLVTAFFVFSYTLAAVAAEGAAAGCSAKYISRLERKHDSLMGIKEDIKALEQGMFTSVPKINPGLSDEKKHEMVTAKTVSREIAPDSYLLDAEILYLKAPISPKKSLDDLKREMQAHAENQ